ncbi:MAG: hypothetical protein KGZ93_07320 [Actinobacteria bacterium]|jgi:hypothetical protein|nr:hypothetical protein [Actinomycetota bacterium]
MSALDSLKGDMDPLTKRIVFTAIFTSELEKEGCSPVAAGDYAVELYTSGEYKAAGVDVIAPSGEAQKVLRQLGFTKNGDAWVNSDIDMTVRIVDESLGDEQLKRVNQIDVSGASVYLLGLEDTVLAKLRDFAFEHEVAASTWAQELVEAHPGEIDWMYLKANAEKEVMVALEGLIGELGIEEDDDDMFKAKY